MLQKMIDQKNKSKYNGTRKPRLGGISFTRILVKDQEAYGRIILYLESEGKRQGTSSDYVLHGGGIARTNSLMGIIELTKEVKPEIKEEIEKIVMRYST